MVASVVLLTYALAFVMPSNMGRIALLMPIVAAMAKRAGIADGSRAWFGLALAVGFGTFQLSATILPANVPNLVMSGAAEGSYGIHLNYVPYLLLHTPVLAFSRGWLLIGLICWLFPGVAKSEPAASYRHRNQWTATKTPRLAAGGRAGDVGDGELARHWSCVDRACGINCGDAAADRFYHRR